MTRQCHNTRFLLPVPIIGPPPCSFEKLIFDGYPTSTGCARENWAWEIQGPTPRKTGGFVRYSGCYETASGLSARLEGKNFAWDFLRNCNTPPVITNAFPTDGRIRTVSHLHSLLQQGRIAGSETRDEGHEQNVRPHL